MTSLRRHYPDQVLGSHSRASQPGTPHAPQAPPRYVGVVSRTVPQSPTRRQRRPRPYAVRPWPSAPS